MGAFLTPEEFAEKVSVNYVTVLRWCRSGKIEAKKFGKSWRIHEDELKKILPEGQKK